MLGRDLPTPGPGFLSCPRIPVGLFSELQCITSEQSCTGVQCINKNISCWWRPCCRNCCCWRRLSCYYPYCYWCPCMLLVLFLLCVRTAPFPVYMLIHIYWAITDNGPTEYRNIECETDKLEKMSDFLNGIHKEKCSYSRRCDTQRPGLICKKLK